MSDVDPSYWGKLAALLRATRREQPVFVDGGANRGDFTALLLEAFPGAAVHAVEPQQQLCAALEARFVGARVRVWNVALHDEEGEIALEMHADPAVSSVLARPARARRYFNGADRVVATVPVRALPLDHLARDAGIERIDFLKLDTQGAERAIIRGARRLLSSAAIDVIYIEFFVVPHYEGAALLHQLWAALAEHDYGVYDIFKGPHGRNGQLRFGDAIFVSPRVRERHLDAFPEEA
jgi:FkbM family methyltransferase